MTPLDDGRDPSRHTLFLCALALSGAALRRPLHFLSLLFLLLVKITQAGYLLGNDSPAGRRGAYFLTMRGPTLSPVASLCLT